MSKFVLVPSNLVMHNNGGFSGTMYSTVGPPARMYTIDPMTGTRLEVMKEQSYDGWILEHNITQEYMDWYGMNDHHKFTFSSVDADMHVWGNFEIEDFINDHCRDTVLCRREPGGPKPQWCLIFKLQTDREQFFEWYCNRRKGTEIAVCMVGHRDLEKRQLIETTVQQWANTNLSHRWETVWRGDRLDVIVQDTNEALLTKLTWENYVEQE